MPTEVAGITVEGTNKWLTLIQVTSQNRSFSTLFKDVNITHNMEMQITKRKKHPWGEVGSLIAFGESVYKATSSRRQNKGMGSGNYVMDVVYVCEIDDLPKKHEPLLDGWSLSWENANQTPTKDPAELMRRVKEVSERFERRSRR